MKVNVDYILELIHVHNMTLGQLSIKSGISKSQLSRILAGKRGIGMKSVNGILRAFPEASISQIFLPEMLPNGNKEKGGSEDE